MFRLRLKELRENKGLSQYKLAYELQISQACIGHWESGTRECDFSALLKLAEYFDVSVDYLLGRDIITPADRTAGWVDNKKVNLTPEQEDWLTKRDEILRLYGKEGLCAVTAMVDAYINAKTANFQQKSDKTY